MSRKRDKQATAEQLSEVAEMIRDGRSLPAIVRWTGLSVAEVLDIMHHKQPRASKSKRIKKERTYHAS